MSLSAARRNYEAVATGGKCDNGGLPDCHCQCGAGHDDPPGAVVNVQAKVGPACNGLSACEFPICWATGAGQPGDCAKPGAVALGDPCLKCKKDFQVNYDCSWGWSFIFALVVVGGLYVGAGWIANHRFKGLDGVDALPHADRWSEFAGLARDGIRFTQAHINGQNRYKAVKRDRSDQIDADRDIRNSRTHDRSHHAKDSASRESGSGSGRKSGDRGNKRSSKATKDSKKVSSGSKMKTETTQNTEGAAAEARAENAVRSSPSGAGGRWVHVPN